MIREEQVDSEEEILVFAEFEDTVNIGNYRSIHVLGISGQNPIIQLDDTIFTGQLECPLGSYMFFDRDPAPQSMDPLFDKLPKENVKYVCKANKYLKMKHTYITPREGAEADVRNAPPQEEDDLMPLTFKSVQDAVETFKTEWQVQLQDTDMKIIPDTLPCDQDMTDLDYKS